MSALEAPTEADAWSIVTADVVLQTAIDSVLAGKSKAQVVQQLTEFRSAIHARYVTRQLALLQEPSP